VLGLTQTFDLLFTCLEVTLGRHQNHWWTPELEDLKRMRIDARNCENPLEKRAVMTLILFC